MTGGLMAVYVAAMALGAFSIVLIVRLRKAYGHPFLARAQLLTVLMSLIAFAGLVVRSLGPGLRVVRPEQSLGFSMLFGFILIPALIALCFAFLGLAFSLVQTPIPRTLTAAFASFWGLFFLGFIFAEWRFFQSGSMAETRIFEMVFNVGLAVFFLGADAVLIVRAGKLRDKVRAGLARATGLLYLAGLLARLSGRLLHSGGHPLLVITESLLLLALNAGIAVLLAIRVPRLGRSPEPARDGRREEESFARFGITRRERDIVRGILQGRSNAEIAASLFISERTVETHVTNIYQKTGVKSRVQLSNLFRGDAESMAASGRP
jgi:DNA-binding CsgD family transcriptional regulator